MNGIASARTQRGGPGVYWVHVICHVGRLRPYTPFIHDRTVHSECETQGAPWPRGDTHLEDVAKDSLFIACHCPICGTLGRFPNGAPRRSAQTELPLRKIDAAACCTLPQHWHDKLAGSLGPVSCSPARHIMAHQVLHRNDNGLILLLLIDDKNFTINTRCPRAECTVKEIEVSVMLNGGGALLKKELHWNCGCGLEYCKLCTDGFNRTKKKEGWRVVAGWTVKAFCLLGLNPSHVRHARAWKPNGDLRYFEPVPASRKKQKTGYERAILGTSGRAGSFEASVNMLEDSGIGAPGALVTIVREIIREEVGDIQKYFETKVLEQIKARFPNLDDAGNGIRAPQGASLLPLE